MVPANCLQKFTNISCICYWYFDLNNWHIFQHLFQATYLYFQQHFYVMVTFISCRCYWYISFNIWQIFLQLLEAKHLYFPQGIPVMAINIPCICYWYISLKIGIFSCSYYMQTPVFSTGFSCFGCRKICRFFFVKKL